MPFRDFLSLTLDNDLSVLNPDNIEVTDSILEAARDDIQEQHSQQVAGDDFNDFIATAWNTNKIGSKIQRCVDLLTGLMTDQLDFYIDELKAEGFDYDSSDLVEYVQCIRNEIISMEIQLKQKQAVFDRIRDKNVSFEPDHAYYSDLLADIRKYEGWNVPDTISTFDFGVYYNRLKKYSERLKKEHGSRAA